MDRRPIDSGLAHWSVVERVYQTLHGAETDLSCLPAFLVELLETGAWMSFRTPTGAVLTYSPGEFERFTTTPPTGGLGASIPLVKSLLSRSEQPVKALDLLDRAVQHGAGRPPRTVDNINGSRPGGTSKAGALRRLRKDRPDLHDRVLAGEMSPHAAMVQAGFRRRTFTVPHDPEAIARVLRRRLDADDLADLVKRLQD